MMNQYEIPAYLQDAIPEMKEELVKKEVAFNIFDPYNAVQCLAEFTIRNAQRHNLKVLKRCFMVAEKLYVKGNDSVKNAIENVFIYSFSRLFNVCSSRFEKREIEAVMPVHLYSVYVQQILKSNY